MNATRYAGTREQSGLAPCRGIPRSIQSPCRGEAGVRLHSLVTVDSHPVRLLNYDAPGGTAPAADRWSPALAGYRCFERRTELSATSDAWNDLVQILMSWGIKTRSGFSVEPTPGQHRVEVAENYTLVLRIGPMHVREPVRIMAVVDQPDRVGFSYGTLDGHPVAGEEAFILERETDGRVTLVLRSISRAPSGAWRRAYPFARLLLPVFRRRYSRALR